MKKRIYFTLLLMSCSISLCFMSSTYSRYVAGTTGNIDILFAKWQILLNNQDITKENNSELTFTPTIEKNDNVAKNTVAPTSKGYFDIDINPENVDVSFKYEINLEIENENIPDLLITRYAILDENNKETDKIEYVTLTENKITNELLFDNETENFQFDSFTVRIFFEWVEGENESMNDEQDTVVGNEATNEIPFNIKAKINFEQIISETNENIEQNSNEIINNPEIENNEVVENNEVTENN